MSEIQKWKENSLKIEGIWLNDTIDVIGEKLLEIEEETAKNFDMAHIEEYKNVLNVLLEYLEAYGTANKATIFRTLDIVGDFKKRIRSRIPKEHADSVNDSLDEYEYRILDNLYKKEINSSSLAKIMLRMISLSDKHNERTHAQHISEKAIHDEEEFLKLFRAGDTFWTILSINDSLNNQPIDIKGPIKIEKIETDTDGQPFIIGSYYNKPLQKVVLRRQYVEDLTCYWHGVCRTEKEALEYLAERTKNIPQAKLEQLKQQSKNLQTEIEQLDELADILGI